MLFGLGAGEGRHVLRIFARNKPSLCFRGWGGFGLGDRRFGLRGPLGGLWRHSGQDERFEFARGSIKDALQAAFLSVELIEGAGVGHVSCCAGERILGSGIKIAKIFGDGFDLLFGDDGEQGGLHLDYAADSPSCGLDSDDEFALRIGLGEPVVTEVSAEGFVIGLLLAG